jgi:hypothetical protein
MRLDTEQALRPVLCLPNPSRMQAARWGGANVDTALRLVVLSLTNPSAMQGARWARLDMSLARRHGEYLPNLAIGDVQYRLWLN